MPKKTRNWARLEWKKCPVSTIHAASAVNISHFYLIKMKNLTFQAIFASIWPLVLKTLQIKSKTSLDCDMTLIYFLLFTEPLYCTVITEATLIATPCPESKYLVS